MRRARRPGILGWNALRRPAQREITAYHAWLEEELECVHPEVIVVLGSTALKSLLQGGTATLLAMLGAPFQHQDR